MSRHDDQRLADILASVTAIADHTRRGGLDDGLVFDAVRVRLIEIGEAVKSIDAALLAHEPDIPWIDTTCHHSWPQANDFCPPQCRPTGMTRRGRQASASS